MGELLFGAACSARADENAAKVEAFLRDVVILDWTQEVSLDYAKAKLDLRRKGRPIPENDIWIGAFSIAYGLTLAARDAHFDEIRELSVERVTRRAGQRRGEFHLLRLPERRARAGSPYSTLASSRRVPASA